MSWAMSWVFSLHRDKPVFDPEEWCCPHSRDEKTEAQESETCRQCHGAAKGQRRVLPQLPDPETSAHSSPVDDALNRYPLTCFGVTTRFLGVGGPQPDWSPNHWKPCHLPCPPTRPASQTTSA